MFTHDVLRILGVFFLDLFFLSSRTLSLSILQCSLNFISLRHLYTALQSSVAQTFLARDSLDTFNKLSRYTLKMKLKNWIAWWDMLTLQKIALARKLKNPQDPQDPRFMGKNPLIKWRHFRIISYIVHFIIAINVWAIKLNINLKLSLSMHFN